MHKPLSNLILKVSFSLLLFSIVGCSSLESRPAFFSSINQTISSTKEKRELVFRLYPPDTDYMLECPCLPDELFYSEYFPLPDSIIADDETANYISRIMMDRLKVSGIRDYQVQVQDNGTIKVSFFGDDFESAMLEHFLAFNCSLALTNSKDSCAFYNDFRSWSKKAYSISYEDHINVIVPINSENERFKAVYEEAKKMAEDGEGEVVDEYSDDEETAEGEEHQHQTHAYLYLWYEYVIDYYSYSKYIDNYSEVVGKVLAEVDAADPFYDNDRSSLRFTLSAQKGKDGKPTSESLLRNIFYARYLVNLFNAEEYPYCVRAITEDRGDAF